MAKTDIVWDKRAQTKIIPWVFICNFHICIFAFVRLLSKSIQDPVLF